MTDKTDNNEQQESSLKLDWSIVKQPKKEPPQILTPELAKRSTTPKQSSELPKFNYAGFWVRVVAYIVDWVIALFLATFVISIFSEIISNDPSLLFIKCLIFIAVMFLYFVLTTCSPMGGTIGKRLLGVYVIDLYGKRLRFGSSMVRELIKIALSSIPILFLIIAFTPEKEGIHDMIARSRAINVHGNNPVRSIIMCIFFWRIRFNLADDRNISIISNYVRLKISCKINSLHQLQNCVIIQP